MSVTIKGLRINYKVFGKGEPILLLHGWGGSIQSLMALGSRLEAEGYKVILTDLPGFGESTKPKKAFSLTDYAEIVELLIEKLKIEDCIIFGHSLGGSIGIKLVLQRNIKAKKLILCNSAGVRNLESRKQRFFNKIAQFARKNTKIPIIRNIYPTLRRLFYYYILRERDYIDYPELAGTFRSIIKEDLTSNLENIDIPTLIIWGEKDKATPLEQGKIMHEKIKDSSLFIIEDKGHGLPKNSPELVVPIILDFLK